MNKWLILLATCLVAFGFAYTVPITVNNPSMSNLGVSGLLFLFILLGLYLFSKLTKKASNEDTSIVVNGEKLIPAD